MLGRVLSCGAGLFLVAMLPVRAEAQTASIVGVVVDAANHVLPSVTLTSVDAGQGVAPSADPVLDATVTDAAGAFAFAALPGCAYVVAAELSGYGSGLVGPVDVVPGQTVELPLRLEVDPIAEVGTVDGSTGAGQPLEKDEVQMEFLHIVQLPTDRFQDAPTLLPDVVLDPHGRLSFNGTRPSQSTLLVNGTNATDLVTGQFAFELPLSVIDTVEVHSAEYGRGHRDLHGRAAAGFRLLTWHFRMRRHPPSVSIDRSRAAQLHIGL